MEDFNQTAYERRLASFLEISTAYMIMEASGGSITVTTNISQWPHATPGVGPMINVSNVNEKIEQLLDDAHSDATATIRSDLGIVSGTCVLLWVDPTSQAPSGDGPIILAPSSGTQAISGNQGGSLSSVALIAIIATASGCFLLALLALLILIRKVCARNAKDSTKHTQTCSIQFSAFCFLPACMRETQVTVRPPSHHHSLVHALVYSRQKKNCSRVGMRSPKGTSVTFTSQTLPRRSDPGFSSVINGVPYDETARTEDQVPTSPSQGGDGPFPSPPFSPPALTRDVSSDSSHRV